MELKLEARALELKKAVLEGTVELLKKNRASANQILKRLKNPINTTIFGWKVLYFR